MEESISDQIEATSKQMKVKQEELEALELQLKKASNMSECLTVGMCMYMYNTGYTMYTA